MTTNDDESTPTRSSGDAFASPERSRLTVAWSTPVAAHSADPIVQVAAARAARMVILSLQPASPERDEKLAALMENVLDADRMAIAYTFGAVLSYAVEGLTEAHGSRQGAADLMTTAMMAAFESLAEDGGTP